jgi:hypothetical protein
MYLIQGSMSGQLLSIPTTLPPGLYEQAGGVSTHGTGGSVNFSTPGFPQVPRHAAVQPQSTGQASPAPPLPNRRLGPSRLAPTIPPFPGVAPQTTGQWDVTPAEKAGADRFFDTLDVQRRGFIEGDVAVPFMLQSNLPEDVLAQVWSVFIGCLYSVTVTNFELQGPRRYQQRWTSDSRWVCSCDAPHPEQPVRQGYPYFATSDTGTSVNAYSALWCSCSSS